MLEESGLCVSDLDKVGVMLFEFVNEPQLMEVHVFRTRNYEGEPQETEGEEADTFVVMIVWVDMILSIALSLRTGLLCAV